MSRVMRVVLLAALGVVAGLVACGAPAGPDTRVSGSAVVQRVRFADDRVTCYVVYAGVSCLRDAP